MKFERKLWHNINSFMTARNSAVVIINYRAGQELGYDLSHELYHIRKKPNIKKIHVYLDIHNFSAERTPVFFEDVFEDCEQAINSNHKPIKIIVHYYDKQLMNKWEKVSYKKINRTIIDIKKNHPKIIVCKNSFSEYSKDGYKMVMMYSKSPNNDSINLYFTNGDKETINYLYINNKLSMYRFDPSKKIYNEQWEFSKNNGSDIS